MIVPSGRSIARLTQLKSQCLLSRHYLVSSALDRVTGDFTHSSSNNAFDYPLCTLWSARSYATRPASRPKQHTGRSTSTRKPRAAASKTAAEPAAKAKPKLKAKPKTAKAKTKAKRKPKAKPKPKRKPKKVLTELQKERKEARDIRAKLRELKEQALKPPSGPPTTAWTVVAIEAVKKTKGSATRISGQPMKEASAKYKSLSPEQLEHYNHIANQNKEKAARAYRQFIESHTPDQIYIANNARKQIKSLVSKDQKLKIPKDLTHPLKDERQVKKNRTSYNLFFSDRMATNDYRGMDIPTRARLVAREWSELGDAEKQSYTTKAAADTERYAQEKKTVLGRDAVIGRHAKTRAST